MGMRHRTQPGARPKSLTRYGIEDTTYRQHGKNKKIDFWFQVAAKNFLSPAAAAQSKVNCKRRDPGPAREWF
jgi:hypothetical protein